VNALVPEGALQCSSTKSSMTQALADGASGCGCPIPGGIQGQAGCGSGQPGLLVGDPAHSRGLELDYCHGPFRPRPFCDSILLLKTFSRFEYPLQSTPKKRRSRSPKDETLQVICGSRLLIASMSVSVLLWYSVSSFC